MTSIEDARKTAKRADDAWDALMEDHPVTSEERHQKLRTAYVRAAQEHLEIVETAMHEAWQLAEPPLRRALRERKR